MKKRAAVFVFIMTFIVLWFSGFLPKQMAKIAGINYIQQQNDAENYKLKSVDYSPAHDCWFVYFYDSEDPDGSIRNIGVYYRWMPLFVYFDSDYPG